MSRAPARCADRSGFLFAHACDRPPTRTCSRCQKPICLQHTRTTEAGPVCITCLRRPDGDTSSGSSDGSSRSSDPSSASTAAAAIGAGAFGGAGASSAWQGPGSPAPRDDPYFYGTPADRAAYYDADDFRAFDDVAATPGTSDTASGEPLETDTDAS